MLTPKDIENKQFAVVRLREGYSSKEVDDFLDKILVSYRELYAELDGYRKVRFDDAPTEVLPAVVEPDIVLASKLLKVAEEACKRETDEAKAQAQEIIDGAHAEAQKVVNGAHAEKHRVVGEMEERKERLTARLTEITSVHAEVIKKLRGALLNAEGSIE
jgi:DivIVA domain-containing protein